MSAFAGDEIRRVATETLLPFLLEKGAALRLRSKIAETKKSDGQISCSVEVSVFVLTLSQMVESIGS